MRSLNYVIDYEHPFYILTKYQEIFYTLLDKSLHEKFRIISTGFLLDSSYSFCPICFKSSILVFSIILITLKIFQPQYGYDWTKNELRKISNSDAKIEAISINIANKNKNHSASEHILFLKKYFIYELDINEKNISSCLKELNRIFLTNKIL